ncbi:MAG: DUF5606 domain-containing protein [Cyclobacteriaceae bacterium]|nr:DUF5606 domain-containing protein [Cyclobacteriaceae bacterium]
MELKDIASVSGKPGLFKVLKQARTGLVLESLDEHQTKIVTGPNHRVSILSEISIYTTDYDKTIPLQEIFTKIKNEFGDDPGVDGKSEPEELKAFLGHVAPDYDTERVYVSDMKKLVSWYLILITKAPEVLVAPEVEKDEETPEDNTVEEKAADEPKSEAKKPKKAQPKTK